MDESEFREAVHRELRRAVPALSPDDRDGILRTYMQQRKPPYGRADVRGVCDWAILFRKSAVAGGSRSRSESMLAALTPMAQLRSIQLRETLGPWVQRIRREVEGSGAPGLPFETYGAAADWLSREAASIPEDLSRRTPGGGRPVHTDADRTKLRRRLELDQGEPRPERLRWIELEGDSAKPRVLLVPHGAPLYPLAASANEMQRVAGVPDTMALAFVLADLPPIVPAYTVGMDASFLEIPTGGTLSRMEVTVRLTTPELTFEQLRQIHAEVCEQWNPERSRSRSRSVSELDVRLCEAVRRRGGPPRDYGKVGPLWEEIGKEVGLTGNAARVRWLRLQDKLNALEPPIEGP